MTAREWDKSVFVCLQKNVWVCEWVCEMHRKQKVSSKAANFDAQPKCWDAEWQDICLIWKMNKEHRTSKGGKIKKWKSLTHLENFDADSRVHPTVGKTPQSVGPKRRPDRNTCPPASGECAHAVSMQRAAAIEIGRAGSEQDNMNSSAWTYNKFGWQ